MSRRPSALTPPAPVMLHAPQSVGALVEQIATMLHGVDDPRGEANDLVAALLDMPRHWPRLKANKWVEDHVRQSARRAATKRAAGAPLAYAVGRANFRHLTLVVDERVLIPRPETELLVDLVLERCTSGVAVDVGTGSGAIAIALATEGKFDRVVATDISGDALDVARANAQLHACNVDFRRADLLKLAADGSSWRVTAVVSNPPYISFEEIGQLPRSVRDWEPALALLSGGDGLTITARIIAQAANVLDAGGLLALEVDARRASLVAEMISVDDRYCDVTVHLDLAGRERFVLARRRTTGNDRKETRE